MFKRFVVLMVVAVLTIGLLPTASAQEGEVWCGTDQPVNITWIAGTVVGCYAGELIPAGAYGIDYALTAMFICLLILQMQSRLHILAAAVSGLLAVGISLVTEGNMYIVIAAMISATICLFAAGGKRGVTESRGAS